MVSYIKSHDFPYQDTSLYMTPGPGYLTVVHGSPGQDTSLYMAPQTRIPHCTWLPRPGYLTVHMPGLHDSPYVSGIPHCVWLPGPGYLTMHDSLRARVPYSLGQDTLLPGPGYLTVQDSSTPPSCCFLHDTD